jgi:hypothetical protein
MVAKYPNQTGEIPVLVLVAALGLLMFMVITSTTSFKDKMFAAFYPKQSSFASSNNSAASAVPTLINSCSACSADADKKGTVDVTDIALVNSCFGKSAGARTADGKSCSGADSNKDGVVDIIDFSCVKAQFGKQCQP